MSTDKIEKRVVLKASHERVWKAVSDSQQFGTWFGIAVEGPFVAGQTITAKIAPTKMDAEVAKMQAPHVGIAFDIAIDKIEPMSLFSFRWHPFGIDKTADYSKEPMTLVEFRLAEVQGGTQLVITETGFDKLPAARRDKAFAANDGGWQKQTELIAKYVER
jgi:uncharacterized protein YndB with AHSA1/START domain